MKERVQRTKGSEQKRELHRKPYRAPRIERLGDFRKLTQGAHVGGIFDGGLTSAY